MRRDGVTAQHAEEQLGSAQAALEERLANRREPGVRGDLDVVESDHGEIPGHVHTERVRGFEDAERLHRAEKETR